MKKKYNIILLILLFISIIILVVLINKKYISGFQNNEDTSESKTVIHTVREQPPTGIKQLNESIKKKIEKAKKNYVIEDFQDAIIWGNHNTPVSPIKVISGTLNMYLIYYGNWPGDSENQSVKVIKQFIKDFNNSELLKNMSTYSDNDNKVAASSVKLKETVFDKRTKKICLLERNKEKNNIYINDIIIKYLKNKTFPIDENGLYYIIPSSNINVIDFANGCGVHGHIEYKETKNSAVKYLPLAVTKYNPYCDIVNTMMNDNNYTGVKTDFLCTRADPDSSSYKTPAINDEVADNIITTMAHEIMETITDPYKMTWRISDGSEIADVCNGWAGSIYEGSVKRLKNGSYANTQIGNRHYLLESVLRKDIPGKIETTGTCTLSTPPKNGLHKYSSKQKKCIGR